MFRSGLFRKILLSFLLLAGFSTLLDRIFSEQLDRLRHEQDLLTRQSYSVLRLAERLRITRLNMESAAHGYIYTGDVRFRNRFDEAHRSFDETIAEAPKLVADTPEQLALLAEIEKTLLEWEKRTVQPTFALRARYPAGPPTPAQAKELMSIALSDQRFDQIRQQLRTFEDREVARANSRLLAVDERGRRMRLLFWLFSAVTVVVVLGVGLFIGSKVTRAVGDLAGAAEKVAAGEYPAVPLREDDELGRLARAFNQMVEAVHSRDAQLHGYVDQERRQVESLSRTLAQQKSRFETVLNTIVDGVIMFDAEGKILMANPKSCEVFGISGEEMTRLYLTDLMERFRRLVVNPEELDAKINALRSNPGLTDEVTIEFKDPSYGAIRLYSVPLIGADGRVMGRIATSLDISKEKEIDRLKQEFISTVSHELRTPLTSIKGSLGLILGGAVGPVNPDLRELLQIAQNNTERLIRLINDILDIFKIESGRIRLRPAPASIFECIQRALAAADAYAVKAQVKLEADVPSNLPPVLADAQRVDQVLINLISNAIKFSMPGDTVTVAARVGSSTHGESSLQEGRSWVEVAVRDRGKGIPAEFLERIFNKFEQVDSSATREHGGTGLGLTISRAIIEQHGGRIWVESQVGQGSTFHFTVPVTEEKPAREASAALSPEARRLEAASRLILVVDDDLDSAQVITQILRSRGYGVITAYSGAEAIEKARRHKPNLVTLDVLMPEVDGFSVLEALKSTPETREIPIIFISVTEEAGKAATYGAPFIHKPIEEEKLIAIVESALAQYKA